jgi:DNA-directed RNA polymerase subunit RPC12/RpoP
MNHIIERKGRNRVMTKEYKIVIDSDQNTTVKVVCPECGKEIVFNMKFEVPKFPMNKKIYE